MHRHEGHIAGAPHPPNFSDSQVLGYSGQTEVDPGLLLGQAGAACASNAGLRKSSSWMFQVICGAAGYYGSPTAWGNTMPRDEASSCLCIYGSIHRSVKNSACDPLADCAAWT